MQISIRRQWTGSSGWTGTESCRATVLLYLPAARTPCAAIWTSLRPVSSEGGEAGSACRDQYKIEMMQHHLHLATTRCQPANSTAITCVVEGPVGLRDFHFASELACTCPMTGLQPFSRLLHCHKQRSIQKHAALSIFAVTNASMCLHV